MPKPKFRFFPNQLSDYGSDAEKETWLQRIKSIISEILNHSQENKGTDGGLYVGSIGIAYMLCYASEFEPLHDYKRLYINEASNLYKYNRNYFDRHPTQGMDKTSFLLGEAGINIVGLYLGGLTQDNSTFSKNLQQYADLAQSFVKLNFLRCGSDELFVGRAGYLCGTYFIKKKLREWHRTELEGNFQLTEEIINVMISSGRNFASRAQSPAPLLYSYYDTIYLGAAHGLSSILQMALQSKTYMDSHPKEMAWVKDAVDWLLSIQQSNGNFAPALDEVSTPRSDKDELVHWCHGAPGIVYLLARAYLVWREEKYLDACLRCGELTWRKGLLTKGPGICHGIAGSGYVFLLLYRLTHDKKHLYRAIQFANFILTEEFQTTARTPDSPYSLYEGLAGTVCFFIDLLQPEKAAFPFFHIFDDF